MKHTYKLTYMYIFSVFIILNAGSCDFPKYLKTNKFHFHVPFFINVSILKSSNRFQQHMTLDNRPVFKYQVRVITVFTVFRLLTDFVCLYNYEFGLSLCKIVRSSVILLLPLFIYISEREPSTNQLMC